MKFSENATHVVVDLSPETDDLDWLKIVSSCPTRGITVPPNRLSIDPDDVYFYGAKYATGDMGLVCKRSYDIPDHPVSRTSIPLSDVIVFSRHVWNKFGNILPEFPLQSVDSNLFLAIALKAYWLGVPIFVSKKLPHLEFTACNADSDPSMLNAHFLHAAYFSGEIYEYAWKPVLLKLGYVNEIDEVLKSEKLKTERKWVQDNCSLHRSEEIFFRKILGGNPNDLLEIDLAKGKATPNNQAAYIAYEARRSPGREWGHDKGRLQRHMNQLVDQLLANGKSLENVRLLDLGSRDGWYLEKLGEMGLKLENIDGMEITPWSAKHARSVGRPVHTGDVHDLSRWEANTFDTVTSWHNLEHCHSPAIVIGEIKRVLKPDGLLMLVVPLEANSLSLPGDHCWAMRSVEDVLDLIQGQGFRCLEFGTYRTEMTAFFELI